MSKRGEYITVQEIVKRFEKSEIGSDVFENMSISEKIKLYFYSKMDSFIFMSKFKPTNDYLKNCLKEVQ